MAVAFVCGGTTAFAQTATTTATTSPAVTAYLTQLQLLRQMRQGMSGDDIKLLQTILASDPTIYDSANITGYFGPLTALGVKKFQQKHGIEQVGFVGPQTLKELNKALDENPVGEEADENGHAVQCAIVPPGHLIAPGWLKNHGNERPAIPECQKLPPGIAQKLGSSTTATSTSTTTPADTTAPAFTYISAIATGSTTAVAVWITNEPAQGRIVYGTTTPVATSAYSTTIYKSTNSTVQVVYLGNLNASTTYYAVIAATDPAGNTATTSERSFVTN